MIIDEVDSVPEELLNVMVGQFRELYIERERNLLHGLALVGVRAVVGVESTTGSPFNVQRSLHIPNLTWEEVQDLYRQYREESGQQVKPEVVQKVFEVTRGQPGLVSWFGELLTEKYNPGPDKPIDMHTWKLVWHKARFVEPNNTILNLISKARDPQYLPFLAQLFHRDDIEFSFNDPLHNYLYMHGIIASDTVVSPTGEWVEVCRFTSPFVQGCLYDALSRELVDSRMPILALEPLDTLEDVFGGERLDLVALLERYKGYLARLRAKGLNPWREQPRRRSNSHLTEAVGHFHLYAWLKEAVEDVCVISPEFPTGNGRVDLHLRCKDRQAVIEVKSFRNQAELGHSREQAAEYARKLGLPSVTLAVFVPVEDENILNELSGTHAIEGIQVAVVAIGWV